MQNSSDDCPSGAILRTAALIGSVVLLASCAGGQPSSAASTAGPVSAVSAEAQDSDLLYISDTTVGGVWVYSYAPPKYEFVGFLKDPRDPAGECVDAAQDVFVTDEYVTFEFEHGHSKPKEILGFPGGSPNSCSVDRNTGNLAVTDSGGTLEPRQLAIYKRAHGKPALIPAPDFNYMKFCSYDDKGNLFVDGGTADSNEPLLEELPAGSSSLQRIKLETSIPYLSGMQWVGKTLAVGDEYGATIYRLNVQDLTAKSVGTTSVSKSVPIGQFLIIERRILIPSSDTAGGSGVLDFYRYPAGGNPTKVVEKFGNPVAVVLSRAVTYPIRR